MRRGRDVHGVSAPEWGPARLLAVLGLGALVATAVFVGLVLAVIEAVTEDGPGTTEAPRQAGPSTDMSQKDALAAAPMPSAEPEAALPGPVSSRVAGGLELPRPTSMGPADVPTGFPRTPEGALAQLAAIDVTAMESGSLDGVRRVIAEWAAPGGPTPTTWSGVDGMARLLSAAGLSGAGSPQLAVVVRPVMGMIKGTVGPDFAVACVDFELTVTVERTSRTAIADCQRMTWTGDRWVIGAGTEPAPAPSIWPGTEAAIAAGWRDLRHV
ncbi:hypothetical protein [Geodermatophilus sabuli]|uniref:Uncharacterized protein n=1 Tax=Geodermatophilus sabuli TaxID=1564158 RepID=A0A285EDP1_9ACTN|nr:hypothetical protein [Geodermatophilus sabuli]MBB3084688.1 hypothetical protein [Geodermatophilus sabuli]SNX97120.1 hypothetical protein SAMN06893097_10670 [Geodermatophilus sabuli]